MESKVCTKCGDDKLLSEFGNKKDSKDGKTSACKLCSSKNKKLYYVKNRTKVLNDVKKYSEINSDKIKTYQNEYYSKNKVELNEKSKEYNTLHKDTVRQSKERYRNENKDAIKVKNAVYREKNKKEIKEKHRLIIQNRRKTDDLYRLKERISGSIRSSFKRAKHIKTNNTLNILGCSFKDFKTYIESLWEPWMNWDNYGKYKNNVFYHGWDLDHIEPIANAKSYDDVIKLNHYTNFQPLCSHINRNIKRDKF